MTTTAVIYTTVTFGHTDPVAFIMDAMTGYDTDFYRRDIAIGRIYDLVDEEWETRWTQGENTFTSEAAARAYAEETGARHVLRITLDDVHEALTRAFAPTEEDDQ